jgi:hypothetical protein
MQALEVHAQLRQAHEDANEEIQALNHAMEALNFEQSMVECTSLIQKLSPTL